MDLDSSERKPSLSEVLARWISGSLEGLPKAIPAVVTAYDTAAQKASCKPLVMRPYLDEEDARQVDSVPIITGCPVVFPGAAGFFRVTFPISDGTLAIEGQTIPATTGLLVFCDRSIDKWLSGSGGEVDPEIDHFHALTDGVFLPGLNPFGAPLGSCPVDQGTAGVDSGVQIHFHRQIICIGDEAGAQFIAQAQKVLDNFNALQTHFAAIEGVITGPPIPEPGMGAPSAFQTALAAVINVPPNPYPTPSSVAATQGKVQ